MGWQEDQAARLKRGQWWDDHYRETPPVPQWDPGDDAGLPDQPVMIAFESRPPPPDRGPGRDPGELLREAGDPGALNRMLEASYLPGRGIRTPAQDAAYRAEKRRLRAERADADGLTREAARAEQEAILDAERRAMEAGFPRVTEFRAEPWP
jgi:hypothetical protein